MSYIPDNYDLWEQHEREQELWEQKRPICCECKNHITDEYAYEINGDIMCWDCAEEWLREQAVDIDELIEEGW